MRVLCKALHHGHVKVSPDMAKPLRLFVTPQKHNTALYCPCKTKSSIVDRSTVFKIPIKPGCGRCIIYGGRAGNVPGMIKPSFPNSSSRDRGTTASGHRGRYRYCSLQKETVIVMINCLPCSFNKWEVLSYMYHPNPSKDRRFVKALADRHHAPVQSCYYSCSSVTRSLLTEQAGC